ncbi:hypothetical protein PAXRUDRAFT_17335 [Paxillus rubicundulus Ve08.2h10]|uniref:Uncharacterized protein n=1 Tax=Paxillus rubicundulus Ve08.2h10 TaxID=930991 RepID=A0A0D0DHX1_9AGAM|nr:hypothetical protein PAXRUDRAFT_17335 [Paxillus rubicundulus Ve08.2h10]
MTTPAIQAWKISRHAAMISSAAMTMEVISRPTSTASQAPPCLFSHTGTPSTVSSSTFDRPLSYDIDALGDIGGGGVYNQNAGMTSVKWHHRHSNNMSNAHSPPLNKSATTITFTLPDHNQPKEALKSGSGTYLDMKRVLKQKIEAFDFHLISTLNLEELVGDRAAFNVKKAEVFCGKHN